MSNNNKYLRLINCNNVFDKSMLKDFKFEKVLDVYQLTYLEKETFKSYVKMAKMMNKKHGIALSITSASRTVEEQAKLLESEIERIGKEKALDKVALPGTSEHHLGLALDVGVHKNTKLNVLHRFKSPLFVRIVARLSKITKEERDEMYKILHTELEEFGFILRYPHNKANITGIKEYEPWHIRYVGIEHAKEIKRLGMCLEEYVEYVKSQEKTID